MIAAIFMPKLMDDEPDNSLGNALLEHYFRAVVWLGRIDLRIIDVQSDGSQIFERGQLEAAVALRLVPEKAPRRTAKRRRASLQSSPNKHGA